jgi:hypothetical protein
MLHFQEKLEEARYFLQKLEETPQDNAHNREFMYVLSAFLTSWRSVTDLILYDYAEKFGLGFSREDDLSLHDFELAARVTNNLQAQQFLTWFKQQAGILSNNPLWRKRNIIVHRGYPPTLRVYSLYLSGSISLSASFSINQPAGSAVTSQIPQPSATQPTPAINVPVVSSPVSAVPQIRFVDLPEQGVIDSCRQAMNLMQKFVDSALKQFGS